MPHQVSETVPGNIQESAALNGTQENDNETSVQSQELSQAAFDMRSNNAGLIGISTRTNFDCFDDLDIARFEPTQDYLVNFMSKGIYNCHSTVLRPVSILWPETYKSMAEELSLLDAFLINTHFQDDPVEWMLKRGLTSVPDCSQCKGKMILLYDMTQSNHTVKWQCQKTQECLNYFMPVQRPTFFKDFEHISLDKLLYAVYFWSICTPAEPLLAKLNLTATVLNSIWMRLQKVCHTALEKSYPRHRLTNYIDQGPADSSQQPTSEPIDLISMRLNDVHIVCAKHPKSNMVRLGKYIPHVSRYNLVDLTQSWFAHGAQVRVSQRVFMDLAKKRDDLNITMVPRMDMICEDGKFSRNSAFGYILCQMAHIFKDFDSTTVDNDKLDRMLSELQWREQYGTTPYDAFTNIVSHISQYGCASVSQAEPRASRVRRREDTNDAEVYTGPEYKWAESHFYATVEPLDDDGKPIQRFSAPPDLEQPPAADVRVCCHTCKLRFECFEFSVHMINHVEANRHDFEKNKIKDKELIECKHCFKIFPRHQITVHNDLFRSHYHQIKFGCRICCIKCDSRESFLAHMRRYHFQHETPYHCPSCEFASSSQRDVFIHFQEEHRHQMILLCPVCLRSFTVKNPKQMNLAMMNQLSLLMYNHLSEHYAIAGKYSCLCCCLSFVTKDELDKHTKLHHNPLQPRSTKINLQPFVVAPFEEKFCVKALDNELFIPNTRPNVVFSGDPRTVPTSANNRSKTTSVGASEASSDSDSDDGPNNKRTGRSSTTIRALDTESETSEDYVDALDNVEGLSAGTAASRLLAGGEPTFHVLKRGQKPQPELTSEMLIECMSKLPCTKDFIDNESVILTPSGQPAKCVECAEFITPDHFVSQICCKPCNYKTHCPRASTYHQKALHSATQSND